LIKKNWLEAIMTDDERAIRTLIDTWMKASMAMIWRRY
jgi:hypothetical protein